MNGRASFVMLCLCVLLPSCDAEEPNNDASANSAIEAKMPAEADKQDDHVLLVDASDVAAAYAASGEAAGRRFDGHYLTVTGRIKAQRPDIDGTALLLSGRHGRGKIWVTTSTLVGGSAYGDRPVKDGDLITIGCTEINAVEQPVELRGCDLLSILDED